MIKLVSNNDIQDLAVVWLIDASLANSLKFKIFPARPCPQFQKSIKEPIILYIDQLADVSFYVCG